MNALFSENSEMISKVEKDAVKLNLENQRYKQELAILEAKKQVIEGLLNDLTFTQREKKLLLESDGEDSDEESEG